MYVVLVYDVEQKRVAKVLKVCRRYLNWIQNSVFEGEITAAKLRELIYDIKEIIDIDKDGVIIFKSRELRWMEKTIIGKQKSDLDNVL